MSDRDNHYAVLGIPENASQAMIKKAYLARIRQHHPDRLAAAHSQARSSGDQQRLRALENAIERATHTSRQINTAYHVLSHPERRQRYDASRKKPVPVPRKPIDPEDERLTIRERRRVHRAQREAILREREKQKQPAARPGYASATAAPAASTSVSPVAYAMAIIASLAIVWLIFTGLLGVGSAGEDPSRSMRAYSQRFGITDAVESTVTAFDRAHGADQSLPVPLDLTPDAQLLEGDRRYSITDYDEAVGAYTVSINRNPDSALRHYKRGLARRAAVDALDEQALQLAVEDFSRTLELDTTFITAYRARGLTRLELWAQTGDESYRQAALRDLQDYFRLAELASDDEIAALITSLEAALVD